jgi:peptidoglycan hydrolase-like protein with peptidoglycan-binding domain
MSAFAATPANARRPALRGRPLLRTGLIIAAIGALAPTLPAVAAQAAPAYPVPRPPVQLPVELDPIPANQSAKVCDPTAKAGVVAFRALILSTYTGSGDSGISRACATKGSSEHHEGRAWDWRVSATNATQAGQANALLSWMTAADSAGRHGAMARRLGIMYIIWNDRIWSPGRAAEGWRPYVHAACRNITMDQCSVTLRHRDHVHFSFTAPGAMKQTSFWTGEVGGTGSTGTPTTTPPVSTPGSKPSTPAAVRLPASLTSFYGVTVRPGQRSEAVRALQNALRMTQATGYYGLTTKRATVAFQKAHRLSTTGVVTRPVWVALQRELNRHAARISPVTKTVLRPGARNSRAVPVLEAALRRPVDSGYDATTVTSLKAFQTSHGLRASGVVDYRTWQALRRL